MKSKYNFYRGKTGSAKKRGMTLLELLVTLLILSVLAGCLFWMILTGKTYWLASSARNAGSHDLWTAFQKIARELQASGVAVVTDNTAGNPPAFGFLSAYDSQGNFITDTLGAPTWQKCVIYYLSSPSNRLMRREIYGTFTQPLTAQELAAYCDGQGVMVAASITQLGLTVNIINNSVQLTLTAENAGPKGESDRQTNSVTIFLKN